MTNSINRVGARPPYARERPSALPAAKHASIFKAAGSARSRHRIFALRYFTHLQWPALLQR